MKGLARRGRWALTAGVALLVLAGIGPVLVLLLDAGYLRGPLLTYVRHHYDRPIGVEGAMQIQLWSRHPRIVAQQVSIGNPPWVAAGETARIERLSLVFTAPSFGRGLVLESIAAEGATLHLLRDDKGHANWQRFDPDTGQVGKGMALIRVLSVADAHLVLDDQLRHLQFDGRVNALGPGQAAAPLHIEGDGQLNGRPAEFELSGDPLIGVRRDVPYAFELKEQSSGSHVNLHGSLPRPFDFNLLDATFEAAGADLKDLYFLTGVTLLHSGVYRLSGSIERRGRTTRFEQLTLSTGQSDIAGSLSSAPEGEASDTGPSGDGLRRGGPPRGGPPRRSILNGTLTAGVLHLADFGARAAGVARTDGAPPRLFSDAAFNQASLRRSDVQLSFEARRVDIGRTTVQSLSGQMTIDHGVLTVPALRGKLMQGNLEARLKLDANKEIPSAEVSMRFTDLQLSALEPKEREPPLEGAMQVRIDITGQGASLHQVAASADGTVSATLPHGTIRMSLAELAGVDLRGLGLVLTHSRRETAVRCAVAAFEAHDGTLTARSFIIDTLPVLIRGEGMIHLDTESLDLALRGEPKDVRLLRVNTPLLIRGTLRRPSVSVETHDSSVQLIDPGHGKDVDCASLLAPPQSHR